MTHLTISDDIKNIKDALSSNESIVNVFIMLKILASKVKSRDMLQWTSFELSGYPEDLPEEQVPGYRRAKCSMSLHYMANHYGSTVTGTLDYHEAQAIEQGFDKDVLEIFNYLVRSPIGLIENLVRDRKTMSFPMPTEFGNMFFRVNSPYKEQYYLKVNDVIYSSILSVVKGKVLDAVIEIAEDLGDKITLEEAELKRDALAGILPSIYIIGRQYNQNGPNNQGAQGDHSQSDNREGNMSNEQYNINHSNLNQSQVGAGGVNTVIISSAVNEDDDVDELLECTQEIFKELHEHQLASQDLLISLFGQVENVEKNIKQKLADGELERKDLVAMLEPIWEKHMQELTDPEVKAFLKKHGGLLLSFGLKKFL